MNRLGFPLLTVIIFLPLFGAGITLLLPRSRRLVRVWALAVSLIDLALAGLLWGLFDYGEAAMQFVDRAPWIDALGISYSVGVDGINLWFLLLAALLVPAAVWVGLGRETESSGPPGVEDPRPFVALMLALETGVIGTFSAVDLILFFLFWEATIIPAYFLIGLRGSGRRAQAALKFALYTMAGSALMLVAILVLASLHYQASGELTFDRLALQGQPLPWAAQLWLFLGLVLAFAVKAPIWPLHGWLPDAYVESPAPVTIVLAAVLSKMGIYGLVRLCLPLFPSGLVAARPWIWILAIAGIGYGSLLALVQRDTKRLVAYSSLAHTGLIFAGALASNVQAVQGAIMQSVSHGLTVTALFLAVDWLETRRGTRQTDELGGLWKSMPVFGTLLLVTLLAAAGLPGLSGFPGEFSLLAGLFQRSRAAAILAAPGMVLGAWYLLHWYRRAFHGPLNRPENRTLPDLRRREAAVLLPLAALMFLVGILPNLILRPTDHAVSDLLNQAEARQVVRTQGSEQP